MVVCVSDFCCLRRHDCLSLAGSLTPSGTSVLSGNHEIIGRSRLQAAHIRDQESWKGLAVLRTPASAVVMAETSVGWAAPTNSVCREHTNSVSTATVQITCLETRHAGVDALWGISAAAHVLNWKVEITAKRYEKINKLKSHWRSSLTFIREKTWSSAIVTNFPPAILLIVWSSVEVVLGDVVGSRAAAVSRQA